VQDALLGAQPAELRIHGQLAVQAAHVGLDGVQAQADDVVLERVHGGHRQLVPAARW
jgi:hypothetical protein